MRSVNILIASRCRSAAEKAREILSRQPAIRVEVRLLVNGTSDPLAGLAALPDLLMLYDHNAREELEALQARPAETRPELLVFGPGEDPLTIRLAMRAGARDYLTLPLVEKELLGIVSDLRLAGQRKEGAGGSLQVFMNGKGGSGASFLATNVAHGLACDGHRVTLVDLDLQFAGLCRYLDIAPREDIVEAMRAIDDMDELAAQAFTTVHDSGLRLLSAKGERLILNQDVPPANMVRLLDKYRRFNDFVIADLPNRIDNLAAGVLEHADRIVLVMQQSFPHLYDTARLMQILRSELHIDAAHVTVVVNRYSQNLPITLKDVETTLRTENIVKIPNQFRISSESVNSGVPLKDVDRKSSIGKGLRELHAHMGVAADASEGSLGRTLTDFFRR